MSHLMHGSAGCVWKFVARCPCSVVLLGVGAKVQEMSEQKGQEEVLVRSQQREPVRIRVSEHVSADGVRIIMRRPANLNPKDFAVGGSKASPNDVIIKHRGRRIYKHKCDFAVNPRRIQAQWCQNRREMHISVSYRTGARDAPPHGAKRLRHLGEAGALGRGFSGQTHAMSAAQQGAPDVMYRGSAGMYRQPNVAPGASVFGYRPTAPPPVQNGEDAVTALLSLQGVRAQEAQHSPAPAMYASNGHPMGQYTSAAAAPVRPSVADTIHMHLDAAARAMRMMHQMRGGPPLTGPPLTGPPLTAQLGFVPQFYPSAPTPQHQHGDDGHHHRRHF